MISIYSWFQKHRILIK